MAGGADDIEVVVLRAGEDGEAFDGRPPDGRPRRRWGAALAAAAVVVATLAAPVARGRPQQESSSPGSPATEPSRCPGPETRRLWCSFVSDDSCCPPDGGQEDRPSSREGVD